MTIVDDICCHLCRWQLCGTTLQTAGRNLPPHRSSTGSRAVDRTHLASDLSPRSRPYRSECERYRSTLLAAPIGALGGLVAARRSARATRGDVPGREVLAFGTKGGKSVENGEKRSLLEQKGEIQQKEIEFHRISSKFGQIRLKRQLLEDGRTDGRKITQLRA